MPPILYRGLPLFRTQPVADPLRRGRSVFTLRADIQPVVEGGSTAIHFAAPLDTRWTSENVSRTSFCLFVPVAVVHPYPRRCHCVRAVSPGAHTRPARRRNRRSSTDEVAPRRAANSHADREGSIGRKLEYSWKRGKSLWLSLIPRLSSAPRSARGKRG